MKIFIQVDIESPNDYPTEEGNYFCNRNGYMSVQKLIPNNGKKSYMCEIRYYLKPVEVDADLLIELAKRNAILFNVEPPDSKGIQTIQLITE